MDIPTGLLTLAITAAYLASKYNPRNRKEAEIAASIACVILFIVFFKAFVAAAYGLAGGK